MTQSAYLSLGSNVGDREGNLRAAVQGLSRDIEIKRISSLYETMPVGETNQPAFLNIALHATTNLPPPDLLSLAKRVERQVGRRVTYHWGPRVIDIDIVLYGDVILETRGLIIPHREMTGRAFVLIPLAEIVPHVVHPILGRRMDDLAREIPDCDGVRLVAPYESENRSSAHGSPSM